MRLYETLFAITVLLCLLSAREMTRGDYPTAAIVLVIAAIVSSPFWW